MTRMRMGEKKEPNGDGHVSVPRDNASLFVSLSELPGGYTCSLGDKYSGDKYWHRHWSCDQSITQKTLKGNKGVQQVPITRQPFGKPCLKYLHLPDRQQQIQIQLVDSSTTKASSLHFPLSNVVCKESRSQAKKPHSLRMNNSNNTRHIWK